MNDIDLEIAQKILLEAIFQPVPVEEPPKTLAEIARERELEIVPMDFARGTYFGFVLGVEGAQCLVNHTTKKALLLDLDDTEIPEGGVLPRGGDQVFIKARLGVVEVAVKVSEGNKREDRQRLADESHGSSRMGEQ